MSSKYGESVYDQTKLAGSTYSTATPSDFVNLFLTAPIPIVVKSYITRFLVKS